MFDRGPNAQGRFNLGGNTHLPFTDPSDLNSARLESVLKDITIYKSRGAAIWARGENHIFDGLKIADSAIGYTHAYPGVAPYHGDYTSKVMNSLFVGESDNKGTPKTEAEIKYGRTLPRADADYPVRGYEYYDFLHHVVNTKFVNFQDNATRKSGAISYLLYTSFGISSNNSVEKVTFENAKPVYFPPQERRWSFSGEFNSFAGWNGAVFKDIDGSLGGGPNSYIVLDTGIAAASDDKDCRIEPTWGAAVCKGDLGRVTINAGGAGGGARGGAGGGAPAAGRGAAPAPGAAAGAPGWLQVLVLLALALLAKDVVVRVQLLLLVPRPLLAQAPREAAVAQEAAERLTRSFSAAMAGILPSPGPPMYAPAPRSRRKPKRRPCPLT